MEHVPPEDIPRTAVGRPRPCCIVPPPYMVTNIVPNQSFSVVQNPHWSSIHIPGIPAGHVNVNVKISSNVSSNALSAIG